MKALSDRVDWSLSPSERRTWPAPCKLNLFLHITGRRPDGYHTLQTLFQLLDYGDLLTFDLRSDGVITRTHEVAGVPEESDLILRAARALREAARRPDLGVSVEVEKVTPQGAGLGGGSSDAATTLVALNRLWELNFSRERLAELALKLGADVPLFVHGKSAWGEGIGEVLTPLSLPKLWFLVVNPRCFVSTSEVFSDSGLTRATPSMKIAASHTEFRNDCESVVRKRFPKVDRAMQWLSQYGEAKLTGTGASIFASFPTPDEAYSILEWLPTDYDGFVAQGVNESVLNRCLDEDLEQVQK
jgi:4-diphosphocytidyl-2-C-methyl-D-erythritol kinase